MDVSVNVGYFGPHTGEKQLIKLDDLGISCIWTAGLMVTMCNAVLFCCFDKSIELGSGIMQIPGRSRDGYYDGSYN